MTGKGWAVLGVVIAVGVISIAWGQFDLAKPAPAVNRAPLKPLAEPVRDTSAPAVASRASTARDPDRPASPRR